MKGLTKHTLTRGCISSVYVYHWFQYFCFAWLLSVNCFATCTQKTSIPFLLLSGFVLLNLNDVFLLTAAPITQKLIWKDEICWNNMVGNVNCLVQLVFIKLKKRSFGFTQAYFLMIIMLSSSLTNRALVWLDRGS